MKAIIFSISAGGGHKNAAEAIKSYILMNEPNSKVEIVDTYKYINPIIDKLIIGTYLNSLKVSPSLYGKLYDYTDNLDGIFSICNNITHKFNKLLAHKLLPLIDGFKPDVIIATHPFPTEMLSILKGESKLNIPVVSLLTDYVTHSSWHHPNIDAYIVSNSDMAKRISSIGISKSVIYDLGIPVKPSFMKKYDRDKTLKSINLSPDKPTILIMGGSLGLGNIADVYKNLCNIDEDIQIIVICGNNKKLYSHLLSLKNDSKKITHIIGFTNEVNKYMQASDLLITKPGGLTITEALICQKPMILTSPLPGVEIKNADFLVKHNLAVSMNDESNCNDLISTLLLTPNKINNLMESIHTFSKPNAGNDIYCLLSSITEDYKVHHNFNNMPMVAGIA